MFLYKCRIKTGKTIEKRIHQFPNTLWIGFGGFFFLQQFFVDVIILWETYILWLPAQLEEYIRRECKGQLTQTYLIIHNAAEFSECIILT